MREKQSSTAVLPKEFGELASFTSKWAQPTEEARNRARIASSMEDIREFYDAIAIRMDEILGLLNGFPPDDLPENLRPLFYLGCAFMEVSPAVERFGAPDVPESFPADRVRIEENEQFGSGR